MTGFCEVADFKPNFFKSTTRLDFFANRSSYSCCSTLMKLSSTLLPIYLFLKWTESDIIVHKVVEYIQGLARPFPSGEEIK